MHLHDSVTSVIQQRPKSTAVAEEKLWNSTVATIETACYRFHGSGARARPIVVRRISLDIKNLYVKIYLMKRRSWRSGSSPEHPTQSQVPRDLTKGESDVG
jgi:hypothetical protein